MCATCGCSGADQGHGVHDEAHDTHHAHGVHDEAHCHTHEQPDPERLIRLERAILAGNDHQAAHNRQWLDARGILAINVLGSPGAGKTTLLARTLTDLGPSQLLAVIEGDQAGSLDADRLRETGCSAIQINTGTGCHLDARMVAEALDELALGTGCLVFVENVGNLVCPALFALGEHARVVLASVAEGDDKPLKYPHMFRSADVVLLNKIDLLSHVDFDANQFEARCKEVNPAAQVLRISARSRAGVEPWYRWLEEMSKRLVATYGLNQSPP